MTLVELAIILGIMGLVMAFIWAAASSVRQRQQVEEAVGTITEIADRVRSAYTAYPGSSNYPSTLAKQIEAGLFPNHVVRDNNTTVNGWGGTVKIGFKRQDNWIVGFSVAMDMPEGLAQTIRNLACQEVISRLQGSGRDEVGVSVVNDVPVPSTYPLPARDLVPGSGPVYAYAGGGGWENVTNRKMNELFSSFGSGGCRQFAFYFRL